MAEEFTSPTCAGPSPASPLCGAAKAAGRRGRGRTRPAVSGRNLCRLAAEILAAHGVTPLVIPDPAPTPAIAYEVIRAKTDGAINFTASHNPPEYNGIKFSTPDGAPALPEVTKEIESEIAQPDASALPERKTRGAADRSADGLPEAPERDRGSDGHQEVRPAALLRSALGRGARLHRPLLREAGVEVDTVHDYRDVLFGGHAPEPDDHLLTTRAKMKETGAQIGIATDGDADRFGIVDQDGTFIPPNYIIALLFDYLVETRGWRNGVAKSVATTNLINALAEHHNVPLYETPVGFKYIGELINEDKIAIGGEESAGLSIRYHVPEKDGVLAGLLCCEMVARRGRPLGEQLQELFVKVGSFYPLRQNFRLTDEVKQKFTKKLEANPASLPGIGCTSGPHRRAEAGSRRRLVGVLPAFRYRAGGSGLHRSAQRERTGEVERRSQTVGVRVDLVDCSPLASPKRVLPRAQHSRDRLHSPARVFATYKVVFGANGLKVYDASGRRSRSCGSG